MINAYFFIFLLALPSSSTGQTALRTATLRASDLKDGLRFLWLDNGRFHPARLNSTPLDDIYSVTMEKQRSNRPDIMPRDDVLNLGVSLQNWRLREFYEPCQ